MSLIIRYVENNEVQESFVGFIDCYKSNFDDPTEEPTVSGEVLANTVLNFLLKHNFNFNDCVGIGTDTCNLMLGEQKGAVTYLQKTLTNSVKCPCSNHSLNLSVSKSNSVQGIRNAVGVMKECIAFFNASAILF